MVVKDVEPYSIVGGNPAKLIRKRFDNEIIDLLESIKWWDWPIEKVTTNLEILTSNDVSKLREISDMKIT